jgi:hypothetical protein
MKKRSTMNKVAGARTTDKIAITIKDGSRSHDRTISIASKRLFDRDIFVIARMLKRWEVSKPSQDSSVALTLDAHKVRVRKSAHVPMMAHNIRQALKGANCAPA